MSPQKAKSSEAKLHGFGLPDPKADAVSEIKVILDKFTASDAYDIHCDLNEYLAEREEAEDDDFDDD